MSTSYLQQEVQLFQNIHILFTPAWCLTTNPLSLATCLYRMRLANAQAVCIGHLPKPLASDTCLSHLLTNYHLSLSVVYMPLAYMAPAWPLALSKNLLLATCTSHLLLATCTRPLAQAPCICHLHTTLHHSINFNVPDNYTIYVDC